IDISSRIASSATLALKSGEWFFRFVIWDNFFHKLIHLNYRYETLRPPLTPAEVFRDKLMEEIGRSPYPQRQ
ncbi:hypothetical protein OS189_17175, partial [Sulfitobacter sp. F26169L]|uniref:hypothetical protein n=1 Tax=Sulfitobacter sp. F26169L TaxID=2996015 RepID=UPI002260A22F